MKKEVRKFGMIGLVFFGTLAGIALWRDKPFAILLFVSLTSLMIPFLLFPKTTTPAYNGWLAVAQKIGKVVNTIILTLAFFLVITPFALAKRMFGLGGPAMAKKPDPEASTYWVPREEPAQSKKRFMRRY